MEEVGLGDTVVGVKYGGYVHLMGNNRVEQSCHCWQLIVAM